MTPLLGSIGRGEVTEILDGGRRRRPSITHLACHPRTDDAPREAAALG
jgi:hypothetical protein